MSITAETPLPHAASSELGTVIPEAAVHDLPLNGRNFTQLNLERPIVDPMATVVGVEFDGARVQR